MLILAFDTAGFDLSVAILSDKKVYPLSPRDTEVRRESSSSISTAHAGEVLSKSVVSETGKQSELLIVEIEKVLREQKIWYHDLNLIVATKGPGSFTGTRIGLTAARTIKAATNLPLILINSDEVKNFEIDQIGFFGLEKFRKNEISQDLSAIYAQGPRITQRKK